MTREETKKKVGELSRNINELRDKLCLAIEDERYEDAAIIRDEATVKQTELIDLLSGSD